MPPHAIHFLLLMSGSTILWGVLTGTLFGMARLPAVLQSFKVDWLDNTSHVMGLCFLIGSVHLTLAHVWNFWRNRRTLQALAQIGWIAITWAMYFTASAMVLNRVFPKAGYGLFGGGIVLVILFMTPPAKFKEEWFNHAMLPLNLVSSFVDVVSYIRLFAVGTASLAVAQAFNQMAIGDGINGFLHGVLAALVLFLGHALNIILSVMGVIVHGVRLNTLEFSGHLGMQWTGIPYQPFSRILPPETAGESVPISVKQ